MLGLLTALALASAMPGARAEEPRPPMNFLAQASKLSQPIYTTANMLNEVIQLPMADAAEPHGATIYLEITRPDPAKYPNLGAVPVILEASPYHGANGDRLGTRIFPDPKDGNTQIGLRGYFSRRGYAVVMMDLRGTGRSKGCLDQLGPKDASDMKAVIEYLAARPWSNGRVGMAGHSYVGASQIVAASQRPKGLVTITPSAGLASMYDHQFQRGVPYNLQWIGPMVAYEWLALLRDLPAGINNAPVLGGSSGDNFGNAPNAQMGCGMQNSSAISGSGQVTGQYELWHAKRDWRAQAEDIDIPIFMIHGVNDNAARIPAAEWFFAHRYQRADDKIWLGQWNHGSGTVSSCANNNTQVPHTNCRFLQWQYSLHAWFDHHLMQRTWTDAGGVERPIDTGPPVEVYLNGIEPRSNPNAFVDPSKRGTRVFTDDAWRKFPKVELYPDASNMSLKFSEPMTAASASYSAPLDAVAARLDNGNLEFVSAPLGENTLFLGLTQLNLRASVLNSQIVHITAQLSREDVSGEREPMNTCAIAPLLRNSIATPEPVIPGLKMMLPMQCFTIAHEAQTGDRLVLAFSTSTTHHASFGSEAQITVYTGPDDTEYALPKVDDYTLYPDVPLK